MSVSWLWLGKSWHFLFIPESPLTNELLFYSVDPYPIAAITLRPLLSLLWPQEGSGHLLCPVVYPHWSPAPQNNPASFILSLLQVWNQHFQLGNLFPKRLLNTNLLLDSLPDIRGFLKKCISFFPFAYLLCWCLSNHFPVYVTLNDSLILLFLSIFIDCSSFSRLGGHCTS